MKALHLAIPAISAFPARAAHRTPPLLQCLAREKLNQVADTAYQKMEQLSQGKMYFPDKGMAHPP